MLKSVRVPPELEPPFARAEKFVEQLFAEFQRRPQDGTLHVGGDRYVLVRAQSLYAGFFDALAESFGEEVARGFIYNTAREIGRSDSRTFSERLNLTDGVDRLASGPVHFAHAGWALVVVALIIAVVASQLAGRKAKIARVSGQLLGIGLRLIALLLASYIIEHAWVRILGAVYLVFVTCHHFGHKKAKKKQDVLRQRLQKLQQQLAGARKQMDDPAEVKRLEADIAAAKTELDKLG